MRRASLTISVEGTDISIDLCPHLISLTYTDKADDELDDLQLVLEDRDGLWQGDWLPSPGDIIHPVIVTHNWNNVGEEEELDCGEFEVDELELETGAGGDTVSIKAIPAAVRSSLMMQRKTRAWGDIALANLVADVVGPSGLDTLYKAPEIAFKRVEQRQESDLAFLQRITKDQGLRLAIKSQTCVVYSGQSTDALAPITVTRTEHPDFTSVRLRRSLAGVYTKCVVGYTSAADSETTEEAFTPDEPPGTGKVLTINKRVEHPAQAERLAKAELRAKNCKEMTGSLDGMGDIRLRAGAVLQLNGWGGFDSNYAVQQATHTVTKDGGYRTSADLVKALDY